MPTLACKWMTAFSQVLNIQQLLQSWGGSNLLDTHFLKAFSKDLFHSHLHRLQLAKCENLTCKWQWSWAMAAVIPLIHWHFWDSETKNVWTFRRTTFGLYTNSSPCSAYAIVIIYSDSQPSNLECQQIPGRVRLTNTALFPALKIKGNICTGCSPSSACLP